MTPPVHIATPEAFRQFGRDMIVTQDLDPLYVGVYGAKLERPQLAAFLMTYWMFYNAGFSAMSADAYANAGGTGYWSMIKHGVIGTNARRGAERRHFRGEVAHRAVDSLADWYPDPVEAVEYLTERVQHGATSSPARFRDVMARAQKWPLFGPWIGFKVADMLDRCGYCAVDEEGCDLAMYSTPVKGAQMYAELAGHPGADIQYAISELNSAYVGLTAPPAHDRPIGIYEIETVLCKTKSAANGYYHIGKDTVEIRHMLAQYPESATAARILNAMPNPLQLELLYS